MNMTKSELIDAISTQEGVTKAGAKVMLDIVLDAITSALKDGHDVTLQGFGTFSVKQREARQGRNPATGATIQIPASRTVGFKPGKALKDAVA